MKSKTPARQLATFIALSFGAAQAAPQNGQFSWANLGTGDSDALVGLSAGKTYLENVNLLGGALTINSVPFTASTVNTIKPSLSNSKSPGLTSRGSSL